VRRTQWVGWTRKGYQEVSHLVKRGSGELKGENGEKTVDRLEKEGEVN
jgi:hypothetical protein